MNLSKYRPFLIALCLILPDVALGYVGPGIGLGLLGSLLAVAFPVGLAVFGVLFLPLKTLWSKLSKTQLLSARKRIS